jgi:Flp pilus assembly protein TadD/thiol-disulfide isomerase/thioredoxin
VSQSPSDVNEKESYREGWKTLSRLILSGQSFSGEEKNCAFLNNRDGTFSTISAVSGFDFPDDGRALGLVDWDFDGDLDLWTTNRTAPRVRFLQNNYPGNAIFVAFHLQGVDANRDGVGAKVRIEYRYRHSPVEVLTRTLRAGEGFLGQSSKWMHFGLDGGESPEILRLSVRWLGPEKGEEVFPGIKPGRFYHLVQGTGQARESETRPVEHVTALHPLERETPKPPAGARILITSDIPLPPVGFVTFEGEPVSLLTATDDVKPGLLLVNLWASWCTPCAAELISFTREQDALRAAGIDVLALAVDGVGSDTGIPTKATAFLDRIDFPFGRGRATTTLLDTLQIIHDELFDVKRSLPVPTSLLVDAGGRLAALYRGPVDIEHLLADVERTKIESKKRIQSALPFPGKWMTEPESSRLLPLVWSLVEHGDFETALGYVNSQKSLLQLDDEYAGLLYILGNRYHREKRFVEAEDAYREAAMLNPRFSKAHHAVGLKRYDSGDLDRAIESYRAALQGESPIPETHFMLAVALEERWGHGESDEAMEHFRQTAKMDPSHLIAWFYLGLIYEKRGRSNDALTAYREALITNPAFQPAAMRIARLSGD